MIVRLGKALSACVNHYDLAERHKQTAGGFQNKKSRKSADLQGRLVKLHTCAIVLVHVLQKEKHFSCTTTRAVVHFLSTKLKSKRFQKNS